jgi:hypothetical protein
MIFSECTLYSIWKYCSKDHLYYLVAAALGWSLFIAMPMFGTRKTALDIQELRFYDFLA